MEFSALPIAERIDTIRSELLSSNRLILQAPPGAGKTTVVPLSLLDEPWLGKKKIILLSPRRIAARTAAMRMAQMLGEPLGERVGYHIRGERRCGNRTRILVITEGILTRYLQNDPALEEAALVIFDEFHERNLHSDLSLAFALQAQETLREDLKLLVMSATLDTRGLSELMGHPPIITSEGRSYPVDIVYRPPSAALPDPKNLTGETFRTVLEAFRSDEGDILVFLPGEREIRDLAARLEGARDTFPGLLIAPLYGNLTREEQQSAILPASRRKIVLATNIAETSLTIEGIRIVIDTGFERLSRFDPAVGMERLVTQRISRASADQRAGRAGRTSAGKCYRMWSEYAHHALSPFRHPDILTADLAPLALELAAWGSDDLRWIDPPNPSHLSHARELLRGLGALEGNITPHGREILSLGLHPRAAHMLLGSRGLGFEGEAILLAVLVSERDFIPADERFSDIGERFRILRNALASNRVGTHLQTHVQAVRDIARRLGTPLQWSENMAGETLAVLLSFAYPDRIARARGGGKFLTFEGKEAYLPPNDPLATAEWLVIARSDGDAKSARIHLAALLEETALRHYHPGLFSSETLVEWNPQTRRVEARALERLGAVLLSSRPIPDPDPEKTKAALLEGIRLHGLESLGWDDNVRQLRSRLIALKHHCPQHCDTDFSDDALLCGLESWLLPHLGGERSLAECAAMAWEEILLSSLSWESRCEFDRLLPKRFKAPTGSEIAIDYRDPDAPVLAVRIQEMFGTTSHPSVLAGKLPLTLHLLSPAHRPIQITRDLVGFWSGSYAEVKKELKGRYPKHYWPDDPAIAQATKKTKKFMEG